MNTPYGIHRNDLSDILQFGKGDTSFFDDGDSPDEATEYLWEVQSAPTQPVSLFMNFPFCPTRCLSCNRDSVASTDTAKIDAYVDSLCGELTHRFAQNHARPLVDEVYVGGGTPNYLSEEQLIRLATTMRGSVDLLPDATVRIHLSAVRSSSALFSTLRSIGVTSTWFEVRDTNKRVQNLIGRSQSLHLIYDTISSARESGVKEVCMDLIYGLPGQTPDSVLNSASDIAEFLKPDRVACSAFRAQPNMYPNQRALNHATQPSLADKMVMFNNIVQVMLQNGYEWLGLDTFVKPGHPLARAYARGELSRNWNGLSASGSREVIGTGVNAISESPSYLVRNFKDHTRWQDAVRTRHNGIARQLPLDPARKRSKDVLSRLICNVRVPAAYLDDLDGKQRDIVVQLKDNDFLEERGDFCALTESGRLLLHPLLSNSEPRRFWDTLWH